MGEEEKISTEPTGTISQAEIDEGKIWGVLGYLGILCLIPLLAKKDNRFALFHAKQGLVLLIWIVGASIIGWIPLLGWMIFFLSVFGVSVLCLIGIIQVLIGNMWKIPIVGDIAEKIKL